MNKNFFFFVCLCVFLCGTYFFYSRNVAQKNISEVVYKKIEIIFENNQKYVFDIADTPSLQERGLSYRKTLNPQTGMIFIFDRPAPYQFWMKDMNFPIDIVWLDTEGIVIHIEHSVAPSTYPTLFGPSKSARYVLEFLSGNAHKLGLQLGYKVNLPL